MLTIVKIIALLGFAYIVYTGIREADNTPYTEPCDYSECRTCPFPCEMHKKEKGDSHEPPESEDWYG